MSRRRHRGALSASTRGQPTSARVGAVLFGPTSSGKTGLSIELALELRERGLRPVVFNADSRQVYRGMDIGTSKISDPEMRGVEHRLLDMADPVRKLALERYVECARDALIDIATDHTAVPVVVGGTGTYVKAILERWQVRGTARLRESLEKDFPSAEAAEAYRLLRRVSPGAAVHPNNYEAIINALVRHLGDQHPREEAEALPFEFVTFGLDRGVTATERRVERTLDGQLARGLLDEVRSLEHRYGLVDQYRRYGTAVRNVVLQTHGYREFVDYACKHGRSLDRFSDKDVLLIKALVLEHIHAYVRHQRTWFKKIRHIPLRIDKDTAVFVLGRMGVPAR